MKDYYSTLGLSKDASEEEIKRAYRKLARTWHPDVCNHPQAKEKFIEIHEAYEVLSNKKRRQYYDYYGFVSTDILDEIRRGMDSVLESIKDLEKYIGDQLDRMNKIMQAQMRLGLVVVVLISSSGIAFESKHSWAILMPILLALSVYLVFYIVGRLIFGDKVLKPGEDFYWIKESFKDIFGEIFKSRKKKSTALQIKKNRGDKR